MPHRLADRGAGYAQPDPRGREAALVRHRDERRHSRQIVLHFKARLMNP